MQKPGLEAAEHLKAHGVAKPLKGLVVMLQLKGPGVMLRLALDTIFFQVQREFSLWEIELTT
jgi:hypothetical protein